MVSSSRFTSWSVRAPHCQVEKDTGRAGRWLRQAAKQHHPDAMYQLGASMINPPPGKDLVRAAALAALALLRGRRARAPPPEEHPDQPARQTGGRPG